MPVLVLGGVQIPPVKLTVIHKVSYQAKAICLLLPLPPTICLGSDHPLKSRVLFDNTLPVTQGAFLKSRFLYPCIHVLRVILPPITADILLSP